MTECKTIMTEPIKTNFKSFVEIEKHLTLAEQLILDVLSPYLVDDRINHLVDGDAEKFKSCPLNQIQMFSLVSGLFENYKKLLNEMTNGIKKVNAINRLDNHILKFRNYNAMLNKLTIHMNEYFKNKQNI